MGVEGWKFHFFYGLSPGAGFTLLESFIYKNNGKITLCSDNVICIMQNGERRFHRMKTKIRGTLFIMNINADTEYIYDM